MLLVLGKRIAQYLGSTVGEIAHSGEALLLEVFEVFYRIA